MKKNAASPKNRTMPKVNSVGLSEKQKKVGPKRVGLGPQPVVNPCHTIYVANAERERQNTRPRAPLVVLMPFAHNEMACGKLCILRVMAGGCSEI